MSWIYEVTTAKFYLNGEYQFTAEYAGAVNYKNSTEFECVKDKGPLPRGTYRIEPPTDIGGTGPYSLPLTPLNVATMCNRDSFRIHGDSIRDPGTASKGCIIANKKPRVKIWESGDRELIVK